MMLEMTPQRKNNAKKTQPIKRVLKCKSACHTITSIESKYKQKIEIIISSYELAFYYFNSKITQIKQVFLETLWIIRKRARE